MKSASDYKRDSALVPSTAIKLHRVKRGGLAGVSGKVLTKVGGAMKIWCFNPATFTACPGLLMGGTVLTKIGRLGKKYVPTFKKIFPKALFKDWKSALTANPITSTKDLIKKMPKIGKAAKLIKVLG